MEGIILCPFVQLKVVRQLHFPGPSKRHEEPEESRVLFLRLLRATVSAQSSRVECVSIDSRRLPNLGCLGSKW